MANVYKLSFTASEVEEKLRVVDNTILYTEQELTEEKKAQARVNIGAAEAYGKYELIETITLNEDVSQIMRNQAPTGENYNFKSILLLCEAPPVDTAVVTGPHFLFLGSKALYEHTVSRVGVMFSDTHKSYTSFLVDVRFGRVFGQSASSANNAHNHSQKDTTFCQEGSLTADKIDGFCLWTLSKFPAGMIINVYGVRA